MTTGHVSVDNVATVTCGTWQALSHAPPWKSVLSDLESDLAGCFSAGKLGACWTGQLAMASWNPTGHHGRWYAAKIASQLACPTGMSTCQRLDLLGQVWRVLKLWDEKCGPWKWHKTTMTCPALQWMLQTDRWWNLQLLCVFSKKKSKPSSKYLELTLNFYLGQPCSPILVTDDADGRPTKLMCLLRLQERSAQVGMGQEGSPILWRSVGGNTSFSEPFLCGECFIYR